MTCLRRKLLELFCGAAALAVILFSHECQGGEVVLHLLNGDRIAGTILSETTNQVTLSNSWAKDLVIPVSQIERREAVASVVVTNAPAPPSNLTAKTNTPPAVTNAAVAAQGTPFRITVPPPPPPQLPWFKHWTGNVLVGTTMIRGATDTELFYGKANLTYSQAYLSDPKLFFRNIFSYVADYGKTAGVLSANDMMGSSKTDFDINHRIYTYNLGVVSYDVIREINLHYEDGPGAGYHLFKQTNFTANLELGANYQVDEQSDDTTVRSVYYRLAEDFNWKITPRMTLSEKYEFFPRVDVQQFRWRFESTLAYALMQNVTFNLGVVDFYDTAPATSVPNNDFEFRTSLGVKF
jgi:hypothetical protein